MPTRAQLQQMATEEAHAAGVSPRLVHAVVRAESSWRPQAHRYEPKHYARRIQGNPRYMSMPWYSQPTRIAASYGLMQLMYKTALGLGFPKTTPPEALYDPRLNLRLGSRLLATLSRQYGGNLRDILAAYNSGRPYAKAPSRTRTSYVPRTLRYMGEHKAAPVDDSAPWILVAAVPLVVLLAYAVLRR